MRHPFLAFWDQVHRGVSVRNWRVKPQLPDRWLRIHTLPGSKRYAESEDEAVEIDARQTAAARAVLEEDAPVWWVTWGYEGSGSLPERPDLFATAGLKLEEACAFAEDEHDGAVAVLVAYEPWRPDVSASVRRAIAEDEVRAMWVHARTGEVFSPYDGGVDLIFSSVERREAARERLAGWLSSRPDGL